MDNTPCPCKSATAQILVHCRAGLKPARIVSLGPQWRAGRIRGSGVGIYLLRVGRTEISVWSGPSLRCVLCGVGVRADVTYGRPSRDAPSAHYIPWSVYYTLTLSPAVSRAIPQYPP